MDVRFRLHHIGYLVRDLSEASIFNVPSTQALMLEPLTLIFTGVVFSGSVQVSESRRVGLPSWTRCR